MNGEPDDAVITTRAQGARVAEHLPATRLGIVDGGCFQQSPTRLAVLGVIPAGAGSTRPSTPARTAAWDHPREHGEHRRWPGS